MKTLKYLILLFIAVFLGCEPKQNIEVTPDDYHSALDKLTEIMVYDIFSPPVASRVYVYPSIAAYEIVVQDTTNNYNSLSGQIEHFSAIPKAKNLSEVNLNMASVMAYLNVGEELIFSTQKIKTYRDSVYKKWSKSSKFNSSLDYANKVSEHIIEWSKQDNYAQTRTMPKFSINTEDPSRWVPTPPDYMDGIEPNWMKMRTFVLDSASQFKPEKPTPFSIEKDSQFYKEVMQVYNTVNKARELGDKSEMIEIAQFWDCNPYVSTHKGHMMFATKKITPGAHWILINKITSQKAGFNFAETARSYAYLTIGVYEAFISVWDEKYRSNLIRPETVINRYIDEQWTPILQTPPFPEYTSGHSVVSGAASEVMTDIYGDDFYFEDTTEVPYGLPVRSFNSFREAGKEAMMSRLYGGIHYMPANKNGLKQGQKVGQYVIKNINL
ncbi:vanadium-dependent haloperoxidase [Flavobacteriaceae bacterium 14752]|uniref:vanadium-dependent haloperoxidase n=1 Tax=Mesohalobacter salilacus TaxID=2491711 RepID=UPI000F63E814|nr:phosphatase PAP2 family protein [Flavobacteriaceae bacterium 14752]